MTEVRHHSNGSVGRVASRFHTLGGPLKTQSGESLDEVTLAYELYGEMNEER